jgi:hypothetical protein
VTPPIENDFIPGPQAVLLPSAPLKDRGRIGLDLPFLHEPIITLHADFDDSVQVRKLEIGDRASH